MTTPILSSPSSPILEVHHITKKFPGVVALNDFSEVFHPGQVHAIVGENGAGKSTLMKIVVGAYIPDDGEILFNGKPTIFHHPREAQEAGISIIYQEFNLLPERTVAQNIFLSREPTRYGFLDNKRLEEETWKVLKQIDANQVISPDMLVKNLSVAEQQFVEIAKAISFDAKVLIMDEPTAALASNEVEVLFSLINRLKERAMTIIFVSHRFKEVFEISQQVTVLKDGVKVDTVPTESVTPSEVIKMMVGRKLEQYYPPLGEPGDVGGVMLEVQHGGNDFLTDINLQLRAGEIVGVAGLQGSGRTELAQALFGVTPFKTGEMIVRGEMEMIKSPVQAVKSKMGFVTEDRKGEGILPNQSVRDNMLLTVRALQKLLSRVHPNGDKKHSDMVPALAKEVDLRAASYDQELQYLSGGNQQKVVLAKWLATNADILILDEPTRGIDVDAKASVLEKVRELAKSGTAILLISSELPEIIGMSDRIIVMWDGQISGELPSQSSESEIMHYAIGIPHDDIN